uniref:Uncharacterized protein n=1 Tax=Plectus sambesii TaxID=2011161 RepID=A0A914WT75_9BILA
MEGIPLVRLTMFAIVFTVLCYHTTYAVISKPEVNCSAKMGKDKTATLSCYTCMGRDSENCDWGNVCCKGSCFKLIDEEHDIIAKGCTNEEHEIGSMRIQDTKVHLYWSKNETLKGEMYYCKGKDYCNGGSSVVSSVVMLLVTLAVLKATV